MSVSQEEVENAYAKWSSQLGGAREFGKIWKWIKKNDPVNAFILKSDTLQYKGLPGHRLPGMPEDQCVIRIPRGQKFDRDRGLYGIGAELAVKLGTQPVIMLIEPGFRADGVLRLVTLKNIANK